jgi:hypothetical protein
MSKSTMTDLVQVLEKRNTGGQYDTIIAEAKAGEFHDFKNQKYACGKMAAVEMMQPFEELKDIRLDIMNGVYDEQMDEEDKARMREDFKDSPEMLKQLGL